MGLIGQSTTQPSTFSTFMRNKVGEDLTVLLDKMAQFQETPTEKEVLLQRRFDELRIQYKKLEWLAVAICPPEALQHINGNQQWLNYQHPTQTFYAETGAFQRIEQSLLTSTFDSEIEEQIAIIDSFLEVLEAKAQHYDFSKGELFYQLANSLHYHYLTTLNAYDRADKQQALIEFSEVLIYQIELLQLENLYDETTLSTILTLYDVVRGLHQRDWASINRAELYRSWILPVVETYMQQAISYGYTTQPTDPIALGSNSLFSTPFFNIDYFTDLPAASPELEQLGKSLFYDPMLSGNNKRSCASCHKPNKAFSDGRQTSIGFDFTSKGNINSPSLINSIYKKQLQHDLSKNNLLEQISFIVAHPKEFNTSWRSIQDKINTSDSYRRQFRAQFKSKTITPQHISWALEAYLATLVSLNSPFDQYMRGETETLPPLAEEGYNLFMSKAQCGNCHLPPLFSGTHFNQPDQLAYFKIASTTASPDQGLAGNPNFDAAYTHFFAVPTVRNLAYTQPYFHDGSVLTLQDGINAHQQEVVSKLTEREQKALLAFLSSLNDPNTITANEIIDLPLTDGTLAPKNRRSAGVY